MISTFNLVPTLTALAALVGMSAIALSVAAVWTPQPARGKLAATAYVALCVTIIVSFAAAMSGQ